ncbi:MAG: hypothetical protein WC444_01930 [Candidatus Paceibacterota bacterium]
MNGETLFRNIVIGFVQPLYQIVIVCAFIYFLYGAAKFIYDMNDPTKKNDGKSHLFWGLIGLFIVFSVGGIIPLINSIFGGFFVY